MYRGVSGVSRSTLVDQTESSGAIPTETLQNPNQNKNPKNTKEANND
jgi:hypothetical protein